jgi:pimeloyl-ACP methyl ester carboxylesterase
VDRNIRRPLQQTAYGRSGPDGIARLWFFYLAMGPEFGTFRLEFYMLRHLSHYTLLIFFICVTIINSSCSDANDTPASKSPAVSREIKNNYNSILKMWPVPYESKYINTSYGKTHIITWGKKKNPPLILLHGLGNCALVWIFIARQLADHFYVIAPDTVGDIGLSVPVKSFKNTKDYAEWFFELLNNIGMNEVNVAGISWGGGVALQAAVTHPNRINRMVVMSPAWGIKMPRVVALLQHVLPVAIFPSQESVMELFGWLSVKRPLCSGKEEDAVVNFHIFAFKHYKPSSFVIPKVFTDDELKQIKVPILLLMGDSEVLYSDPNDVIERAKKNIPYINVKIIPKAGHLIIFDRSDIVGGEMMVFLKENKGK